MLLFFARYIWFIGALLGILFSLQLRFRLSSKVKEHPEMAEESQKLLKGILMFFIIPSLLLGCLQGAGGFDDPFFVFLRDLNIYTILSWCIILGIWASLLHWIFRQDGARIIVMFRKELPGAHIPESEAMVKVLAVLLVVCGVCALLSGIALDIGNVASSVFPG